MGFQIAIDGPAGAGKSTIAKKVAEVLGIEYIDTGAMYRAITLKALRLHIDLQDESQYDFLKNTNVDFVNQRLILDGNDVSEEIRSLEVTDNVSLVAKFGSVRTQLVNLQRKLAGNKDVIMDGRDIGTVVLPHADLKIFLIASVEERAKRRVAENLEKGNGSMSLEEMAEAIKARDYKDSNREISPLKKAVDAIEIDSSTLCIADVVRHIISLVMERGYKMENEIKEMKPETVEEIVEEVVEQPANEVAEPATEEVVENQEALETPTEEVEQQEIAVETAELTAEAEENTEPEVEGYKAYQVLKGVVTEVLDSSPARGKVKAKDQRLVIQLPNGKTGTLLKKDIAGIKEDQDLFDEYLEGDEIEVAVKKVFEDGGILLSTTILELRNELKQFEEVIANHGVFTAKVVKNITAGLLLEYNGFTCLLPSSQALASEEELPNLVGTEIEVAPIRSDYNRTRLIVSERVAKAIKARQSKNEFISQLEVGQEFEGTVKNIEKYGAFIDLGNGVEGLLHISELDHNRVVNVNKIVNVGDLVKVKIIKLEDNHIGLSRKALIPNYWMEYVSDKEIGSVVKGTVTEINNAGLVLQLNENVSGFLPKSEFAWERDVFVEDFVKLGDEVELKIIELNPSKKRIILSRRQMMANPWETLDVKVGDAVTVTVAALLKEGVKVSLNGAIGYASKNNLPGVDFASLTVGTPLEVKVRLFEPERTKLVVGNAVVREREDYQPRHHNDRDNSYNKYMKSEKVSNTLGDLFAEQLKKIKK